MNSISDVTRDKIFDIISPYHVGTTDFLSKIFNLEELPSNDRRFKNFAGDIWQHTENNFDWEDNWWKTDSRLNLADGSDEIFTKFLSAVINWLIKPETLEDATLENINKELNYDGFEVYNQSEPGKRSKFNIKQIKQLHNFSIQNSNKIKQKIDSQYLHAQLEIINNAINDSPSNAIGLCKELIETVLKHILDLYMIKYDEKNDDMIRLNTLVNEKLNLVPKNVTEAKKGHETIKKILGNQIQVVQGIVQLRNDYGTGHGKSPKFQGLNARHARFCLNTTTAIVIFLLDTVEEKQ